jgi:hypothetical protein
MVTTVKITTEIQITRIVAFPFIYVQASLYADILAGRFFIPQNIFCKCPDSWFYLTSTGPQSFNLHPTISPTSDYIKWFEDAAEI